ncbi:MAG: hypothetical protein LBU32_11530 [Clostridiales bacterium]|jgi:hypothetical protein|nr:hypothetical protein [Clostridiales bacterium]
MIAEGAEARPVATVGGKTNRQACGCNGLNGAADPDAGAPHDFDGRFKLWLRRNELEVAEASLMRRVPGPFPTAEKLRGESQRPAQRQPGKTLRQRKKDARLKTPGSLSTAFSSDAADAPKDKCRIDFPFHFYDLFRIADIHACGG